MINLYVEYYNSNYENRKKEIDFTLKYNTQLSFLDKIYIFVNKKDILNCKTLIASVSETKYELISQFDRCTFQDIFNFANTVSTKQDINITLNNDILLTKSISNINLKDNEFYCLSRFENGHISNKPFNFRVGNSQDTWIWKGKNKIINANFYYGLLGCDNALAYIIQNCGYNASNPAYTFRTLHNHKSNIRIDSNNEDKRINLPYAFLLPVKI